MKQKALAWFGLLLILAGVAVVAFLTGVKYARQTSFLEAVTRHNHQWGQWDKPVNIPADFTTYIQFRQCTNCGAAETRKVKASKGL